MKTTGKGLAGPPTCKALFLAKTAWMDETPSSFFLLSLDGAKGVGRLATFTRA